MGEMPRIPTPEVRLSAVDFTPLELNNVKRIFEIFNGELTTISVSAVTMPGIEFVNSAAASTSRLLSHELSTYNLKLPRLPKNHTVMGRLPNILRDLEAITGHEGLRSVMETSGGRLLDSVQAWVAALDQMAT